VVGSKSNVIGIDPGVSFLELHNKIISKTISPMAQWDRLGKVAIGATVQVIGINPHPHQFHFRWIIKKNNQRF